MNRRELLHYLTDRIVALPHSHPTRVAIDGVDASGKTTLADELAPLIAARGRPTIRASIDGFHNPAVVRKRRGAMSAEGYYYDSFNHDALIHSLLEPLGPSGSLTFTRAVFDFRSDHAIRAPSDVAPSNAVLILDGVFLLRPELRHFFDFSIFVRADFGVTLARAESRDLPLFGSVEEIRRRYTERYIPGQQLYLQQVRPENHASIVIINDDPSQPILELNSRGHR